MKHKCMHGPACDDASPSVGDQRENGSVGLLFIGAQPSDLREFRNLRKVCARLLALVKYLKADIASSAQARQMGTTCNYNRVIFKLMATRKTKIPPQPLLFYCATTTHLNNIRVIQIVN